MVCVEFEESYTKFSKMRKIYRLFLQDQPLYPIHGYKIPIALMKISYEKDDIQTFEETLIYLKETIEKKVNAITEDQIFRK